MGGRLFSCISCNKSSTGQAMTSEAAINLWLLRRLHTANSPLQLETDQQCWRWGSSEAAHSSPALACWAGTWVTVVIFRKRVGKRKWSWWCGLSTEVPLRLNISRPHSLYQNNIRSHSLYQNRCWTTLLAPLPLSTAPGRPDAMREEAPRYHFARANTAWPLGIFKARSPPGSAGAGVRRAVPGSRNVSAWWR